MYRAAVVAGVLLLVGCSSDSASPTASASSSRPPVTTDSTNAATSTTSTTASTTTTTVVVPSAPMSSPSEAASTFMSAWRAGDRDKALTVATSTAVDAAFSAGEPGSVQSRGCNEPPSGPVLCVYRTDPGEVQLRVQPLPDGTWYVDQARVTAA